MARISELGISQTDVARKLEVSEAAVSRWISGSRTPSLRMSLLLERELGIKPISWMPPRAFTSG